MTGGAQWRLFDMLIAGSVSRPDLLRLKPDFGVIRYLPQILTMLRGGDDAVLTRLVRFFEAQGLAVLGVADVAPQLLAEAGTFGSLARASAELDTDTDTALGFQVLDLLADLDVGQAIAIELRTRLGAPHFRRRNVEFEFARANAWRAPHHDTAVIANDTIAATPTCADQLCIPSNAFGGVAPLPARATPLHQTAVSSSAQKETAVFKAQRFDRAAVSLRAPYLPARRQIDHHDGPFLCTVCKPASVPILSKARVVGYR